MLQFLKLGFKRSYTLLIAYFVQSPFSILSLAYTIILWNRHHCPPFTDKKFEGQRDEVIRLKSHSWHSTDC